MKEGEGYEEGAGTWHLQNSLVAIILLTCAQFHKVTVWASLDLFVWEIEFTSPKCVSQTSMSIPIKRKNSMSKKVTGWNLLWCWSIRAIVIIDQHPHQGLLNQSLCLTLFVCQTSSSFWLQILEILPSKSNFLNISNTKEKHTILLCC